MFSTQIHRVLDSTDFFELKSEINESFTMKLRTSTGKQYFFIKDNGTFVKLNKHKLLFNYSPL